MIDGGFDILKGMVAESFWGKKWLHTFLIAWIGSVIQVRIVTYETWDHLA